MRNAGPFARIAWRITRRETRLGLVEAWLRNRALMIDERGRPIPGLRAFGVEPPSDEELRARPGLFWTRQTETFEPLRGNSTASRRSRRSGSGTSSGSLPGDGRRSGLAVTAALGTRYLCEGGSDTRSTDRWRLCPVKFQLCFTVRRVGVDAVYHKHQREANTGPWCCATGQSSISVDVGADPPCRTLRPLLAAGLKVMQMSFSVTGAGGQRRSWSDGRTTVAFIRPSLDCAPLGFRGGDFL